MTSRIFCFWSQKRYSIRQNYFGEAWRCNCRCQFDPEYLISDSDSDALIDFSL